MKPAESSSVLGCALNLFLHRPSGSVGNVVLPTQVYASDCDSTSIRRWCIAGRGAQNAAEERWRWFNSNPIRLRSLNASLAMRCKDIYSKEE